jgi:hypothetical protein
VSDVLGHPLVILLAGTVLTGLLVPFLADRRQRRRKALDLDVALTETITETVTAFVMAIQFAVVGPLDQPRLDQAYHDFMVAASVIRAKLEIYHPGSGLADDWTALADGLEGFYGLAGVHDPEQHERGQKFLAEKIGIPPSEGTYGWLQLKEALLARMRNLDRRLLDASRRGGL